MKNPDPDSSLLGKLQGFAKKFEEFNDLKNFDRLIEIEPRTAIIKIRSATEKLARKICKNVNISGEYKKFADLCILISKNQIFSEKSVGYMNNIRIMGNIAVHSNKDKMNQFSKKDALLLGQAFVELADESLNRNLI